MSALPRMRAESVQPSFGRQVRSMGIFHRGEAAEMNNLPIEADSGAPFSIGSVPMSPNRSAFGASVLLIECVCRFSQIAYSVIRRVAVYVVNVTDRPNAVNVKPREAVNLVLPIVDHHLDVAILVRASQNVTCAHPADRNPSRKKPCLWGVDEKLAQSIRAKIRFSHAVVPFKRWFGQRPGSVLSGFGLRYFSWIRRQEVQRHNGFVAVLAPALGMTDEQTDALFVAAAAL